MKSPRQLAIQFSDDANDGEIIVAFHETIATLDKLREQGRVVLSMEANQRRGTYTLRTMAATAERYAPLRRS